MTLSPLPLRRYWMLAASLPHLPPPEGAKRLPIGPQRLQARLQMLEPGDRRRLQAALDVLDWHLPAHQAIPAEEGDPLARAMAAWSAAEPDDEIRGLVVAQLADRALLASLRRRESGQSPVTAPPGLGRRWAADLRRRWHRQHFGLATRDPWLVQAADCVRRQDAIGLERLLATRVWRSCERLRARAPRTFGAVLAYRLQWELLRRRLAEDPVLAARRLEALATATLNAPPAGSGPATAAFPGRA